MIWSLLLLFNSNLRAQVNPWKTDKYISIGLALQGSYFNGDVLGGLRTIRPGVELSLAQKISPHSSMGFSAGWVELLGSDYLNASLYKPTQQDRYIRNLHFKTSVPSLHVFYQYDVFPSYKDYLKRPIYNVFFKAGLGAFYFDPKTKDSTGSWVRLKPLKTEGKTYSSYSAMIPLSLGVRYKISYHFDFEAELTYVQTFTDYLDDVSGSYPDTDVNPDAAYYTYRSTQDKDPHTGRSRDLNYITNDLGYFPIQQGEASYFQNQGPGRSRGSRAGFDTYILVSFRLIYVFSKNKVSCPRY